MAGSSSCGRPAEAPAARPTPAERAWPAVAAQLRPGMGDEEKALAVAAWVAANASNAPAAADAPVPPLRGRCGERAGAFVMLARRAGLRAARLDFTRFGPSAHSAALVWYEGAWHYFDVTYAGYFRRDGRILSFEEIQADPGGALAGMVVLPGGGLDRWSDGTPVDNTVRMMQAYTIDSIRSARLRRPRAAEPFGTPRARR
ncbi:MAG: hypothetical protein MUC67_12235 [Acidobacteria bacterium]|nr:hypothetical protein [Acidobacteriota bacterium]